MKKNAFNMMELLIVILVIGTLTMIAFQNFETQNIMIKKSIKGNTTSILNKDIESGDTESNYDIFGDLIGAEYE